MRNAQNISANFEALPWEEGKGFLWGLPSTIWLLIRHPCYSMSTDPKGKWFLPFLFFCIISFCTHSFILTLVYLNIYDKNLLIDPPNTTRPLDPLDVIYNFTQLLATSWVPDLLLIFIMSAILIILLKIAFKISISALVVLRMFFYSHVSIVLDIVPSDFSFFGFAWMLFFLFYGIKFVTTSSASKALIITGCFWATYSIIYFTALRTTNLF